MRRTTGPAGDSQRAEASDARGLVDLAARMGIPPDDAARQVAQLISPAAPGEQVFAIDRAERAESE